MKIVHLKMVPYLKTKLDLLLAALLAQDQTMPPKVPPPPSSSASPSLPAQSVPNRTTPPGAEPPSARTRVRRGPAKARYDAEEIKSILDAAWLCHISLPSSHGPICIPTIYARQGNEIFVHGSSKSGLLSQLVGQTACVVVSIVDELVLARSAFHHSINYRSVVLYAQAREVTKEGPKRQALDLIVDHLIPERSKSCRPANPAELKATSVYALSIDEASAKVRTGPPVDDKADYALDHWAGVIPVHTHAGAPEPSPDLRSNISLPEALAHYKLPRERSSSPQAIDAHPSGH